MVYEFALNPAQPLVWPYEEIKAHFADGSLSLISPWLRVSILCAANRDDQNRFSELLVSGPRHLDDVAFVNAICAPFRAYPLFYFLPRAGLRKDSHLDKSNKLENKTNETRWVAQDILDSSRVDLEFHDPMSILSSFRRLHLVDLTKETAQVTLSKILKEFEGPNLKQVLLLLLRQNHYITEECQRVLRPALDLHPQAKLNVEKFMESESGHDQLLKRSIELLGASPKDVVVFQSVIDLMNGFEEIAKKNLLAFAFMIDMFERSAPAGTDPALDAFKKIGEEKAAVPYLKHHQINTHGNHDNEAFEMIQVVGAITDSYAKEAIELAKKGSDLFIENLVQRTRQIMVLSKSEEV